MELLLDALLDALIDGVKMLPFLYLAYLLIEWLERHHGEMLIVVGSPDDPTDRVKCAFGKGCAM